MAVHYAIIRPPLQAPRVLPTGIHPLEIMGAAFYRTIPANDEKFNAVFKKYASALGASYL